MQDWLYQTSIQNPDFVKKFMLILKTFCFKTLENIRNYEEAHFLLSKEKMIGLFENFEYNILVKRKSP